MLVRQFSSGSFLCSALRLYCRTATSSFASTVLPLATGETQQEKSFVDTQANLFRKSTSADSVIIGHDTEIPAKAYYVGNSIDIQLVYNNHHGKKILRNDCVILFSPFCAEVAGALEKQESVVACEDENDWFRSIGEDGPTPPVSHAATHSSSNSSSSGTTGQYRLMEQALQQVVQKEHRQRSLSAATLQSMQQQMQAMADWRDVQQGGAGAKGGQQAVEGPAAGAVGPGEGVHTSLRGAVGQGGQELGGERGHQESAHHQQQQGQQEDPPRAPLSPPPSPTGFYRLEQCGIEGESGIMVVHSFGSVVFFGVEASEHWPLLKVMMGGAGVTTDPVPASLITEDGNEWRLTDPEELEVSVWGGLDGWAAKGEDCLMVRQLDVGTLQLVAAVMAQSIALRYHVWMVDAAAIEVHTLRKRAVASSSSSSRGGEGGGSGGLVVPSLAVIRSYTWLGPSATTNDLARLVANANKVAIEVSRKLHLLEYPKLAWQRDRYDEVWSLLRGEFELERMLGIMNKKLKNMAQEVQYDMETMFQWRYDYLVATVILLLVLGNCLDVVDILQELRHHWLP